MTAHDWSHFEDFKIFKDMLKDGLNIFLYGPKYVGKTTLLNDCLPKTATVLNLNCMMFSSLIKLKHRFLKSFYTLATQNEAKQYKSFSQMTKQLENEDNLHGERIIVIFENVEHLEKVALHREKIKEFFYHCFETISAIDLLEVQFIMVSQKEMDLSDFNFFIFTIIQPNASILQEHSDAVFQSELRNYSDTEQAHLINHKNQILSDVFSYEVLQKDFLSLSCLVKQFMAECIEVFNKSTNKEMEKFLKNLFYYDFSYVYKSSDELNKIKRDIHQQKKEKYNDIDLKDLNDFKLQREKDTQFLESLPFVPQILIIAFGLAARNSSKTDHQIFS